MFNIFKKEERVKGKIGYLGLSDWWLESFTKEEKDHIINTFQPLGGKGNDLVEGEYDYISETKSGLLKNLAGWFKNEEDRNIGYKMLQKAEIHKNELELLDLHFYYQSKMQFYYRFRNLDDFAFNLALQAGLDQISLSEKAKKAFLEEYKDSSLPSHAGYEQICIIYEKQKKYQESLELCNKAKNEGWNNDWNNKIKSINKKLINLK